MFDYQGSMNRAAELKKAANNLIRSANDLQRLTYSLSGQYEGRDANVIKNKLDETKREMLFLAEEMDRLANTIMLNAKQIAHQERLAIEARAKGRV